MFLLNFIQYFSWEAGKFINYQGRYTKISLYICEFIYFFFIYFLSTLAKCIWKLYFQTFSIVIFSQKVDKFSLWSEIFIFYTHRKIVCLVEYSYPSFCIQFFIFHVFTLNHLNPYVSYKNLKYQYFSCCLTLFIF